MDTFNFPYHTFTTEYPESGVRMQLGNSYVFTAPPESPDQRKFNLTFPAMQYYVPTPGTVDITTNPTRNAGTLEKFYTDHKLYATFIYPHPVYGDVNVKFNKPLKIPQPVAGGSGVLNPFDVEFIEMP